MNDFKLLTDAELLQQLKTGKVQAFETLFHRYYENLCRHAFKYVNQWEVAEELVSGFFSHIWEKRQELQITVSVKSYLFAAIKNTSFNYLKSQYAKHPFQLEANENQYPWVSSPAEEITYHELQTIIQRGIDTLPERCRIIFILSRNAGLTYEEIAKELAISPKTVKAQMGIALHKLRLYVDRHWDKLLMLLIHML